MPQPGTGAIGLDTAGGGGEVGGGGLPPPLLAAPGGTDSRRECRLAGQLQSCRPCRQRFRTGSSSRTSRMVQSFDQFHDERLHAVRLFQAVDMRDVRVVEGRKDLRFAPESSEPVRVCRERIRQRDWQPRPRSGPTPETVSLPPAIRPASERLLVPSYSASARYQSGAQEQ